jgi:DNA adenine methylase
MVDMIVDLMPDHVHFVELFGGSGAITLGKPYSEVESFNDKDLDIYNLYRCCIDGAFHELKERIANTPSRSQRFYADAIAILSKPITKIPDVKAAWAFLLVAHQSLPCHPRLKSPSGWLPNITTWRSRWDELPKTLELVRTRFANVQLFHDDWKKIVRRLDRPTTLFYVDPPYPAAVLKSSNFYVHEMPALDQHRLLLERLLAASGYVMLSGYESKLYEEMLSHWRRINTKTTTNIGITKKSSERTEVLWLNYAPNGKRL